MRVPKKDVIATALVAVAALLYLFWLAGVTFADMDARATGLLVLGLGFAACALAVVPRFAAPVRGSRTYVAITSLLGVAALVAGIQTLVSSSAAGLAVLTVTMVALWAATTIHDVQLARAERHPAQVCPACGNSVRQPVCDACGYDLIEIARAKVTPRPM